MNTYVGRREKAARLRRAQGIPGYAPADHVISHIHTLRKAGWTNVEIADTAGVDRRTIHNILHGFVSTVHHTTAAKILKLKAADVPNRVPAAGTIRRIQALAVMGWPISHTATAAGIHGTQVNELMAGRRKRIPREQAEAVARIFRERWQVKGPSVQAASVAARNGWVPAPAWDDIDDPDERPQGVAARRTARKRAAA